MHAASRVLGVLRVNVCTRTRLKKSRKSQPFVEAQVEIYGVYLVTVRKR